LPILGAVAVVSIGSGASRFRRVVLVLALGSLILANSLRFWQVGNFIDRQLSQLPPSWALPVEPGERWVLFLNIRRGFYSSDLVRNDPLLRSPRLILISHGREVDEQVVRRLLRNPELVSEFRGQSLWRSASTADREGPGP
jgi:hypothetical protein